MSKEHFVSVHSSVQLHYYLVKLCVCYLESLKLPSSIFCGIYSSFLRFAFNLFYFVSVFPHGNSFNSFNILGLKKKTNTETSLPVTAPSKIVIIQCRLQTPPLSCRVSVPRCATIFSLWSLSVWHGFPWSSC